MSKSADQENSLVRHHKYQSVETVTRMAVQTILMDFTLKGDQDVEACGQKIITFFNKQLQSVNSECSGLSQEYKYSGVRSSQCHHVTSVRCVRCAPGSLQILINYPLWTKCQLEQNIFDKN